MEHRCALAALALILATGCAAGGDTEYGDGYLLLDRAAREGSILSHEGWRGAPVLPVALDPYEPARLEGPDGHEIRIALKPGVLSYVRGESSSIEELEVGSDVRDDRLLLHASEEAASELSEMIGGSFALRGDGLFAITAPDIWMRTSFLNAGESLIEAMPDTWVGTDALEAPGPSGSDSAIVGPTVQEIEDAAMGGEIGRSEALLVGIYRSQRSLLVLDALGRFSMEDACDGQIKAEGYYHASGRRVVLQSKSIGSVALAVAGSILINPAGERLFRMDPAGPLMPIERGVW